MLSISCFKLFPKWFRATLYEALALKLLFYLLQRTGMKKMATMHHMFLEKFQFPALLFKIATQTSSEHKEKVNRKPSVAPTCFALRSLWLEPLAFH